MTGTRRGGTGSRRPSYYHREPLPDRAIFDWLVIMGGPMNVYQKEKYSWLAAEKRFTRRSIYEGETVLRERHCGV